MEDIVSPALCAPFSDNALRPVIEVIRDRCVNCHRCIAVCPVKMCNNGAGSHVEINHDLCLGCGTCISACTHEARKGIDDLAAFLEAMDKRQPLVAIIAPAIVSSFPTDYLRINGWLKSMGVQACFDVSFGAELTVKSYLDHVGKNNPRLVIAQPCPALVTFIETYHPELLPYLAPADSPMVHTMKMVRRFYPAFKKSRFAVISPCLAKRREFDAIGFGDFNVTMKSIANYLSSRLISLSDFPEETYDNPPAERAVLFPTPGGLMRTVLRHVPEMADSIRKIEGNPHVYHYLSGLASSMGQGNEAVRTIVDGLNCEAGCNGGAGSLGHGKHAEVIEAAVEKRSREMRKVHEDRGPFVKRRKKLLRSIEAHWEPGLYRRAYKNRSAVYSGAVRIPSETELARIYEQTYKHEKKDFLNCGSCGYNSCEEMATAIFNRLNRPENCRHYQIVMTNKMREEHARKMVEATHSVATSSMDRVQANLANVQSFIQKAEEMTRTLMAADGQIKNMIEQVGSINAMLNHNNQLVDELKESSAKGKANIQVITDFVNQMSEKSESLNHASQIIKTIVSRTTMLAMNASIEAAHAGQYGKGFSIVAEEIHRMAEDAGKQATSISQVLKLFRKIIDSTETAAHDSRAVFNSFNEMVLMVHDKETNIAGSINDLHKNSNNVLDNLALLNDLAMKFQNASREHLLSSERLLEDFIQLTKIQ